LSVIPLRSVSCVFTIKIGLDWIGTLNTSNICLWPYVQGLDQRSRPWMGSRTVARSDRRLRGPLYLLEQSA